MLIEPIPKIDFNDVLIKPKRSTLTTRSAVELTRSFKFLHDRSTHQSKTWKGIPIIASNMSTVGTLEMAHALAKLNMLTALHKYVNVSHLEHQLTAHTFRTYGIVDMNKVSGYMICLDVANGYQQQFVEFVHEVRIRNSMSIIMAGNVCTSEQTEELLLAGADIVKVGIGPGKACKTREITGVGIPQLTAIIECADAAHGLGGHICADGGCESSGDIVKAFSGGADFVMLGYMLGGHDECQATSQDGEHVEFYGMASKKAMAKYSIPEGRTPEGRSMTIEHRGSVVTTVQKILGGIKSACTYTGSKSIKELPKRATFILV